MRSDRRETVAEEKFRKGPVAIEEGGVELEEKLVAVPYAEFLAQMAFGVIGCVVRRAEVEGLDGGNEDVIDRDKD